MFGGGSRSVSGMELLIEELVEVTVLMEGLMPYGGYTPVMAAVWDTQAAGSMGRIGSPVEANARREVRTGEIIHSSNRQLCVFTG